MCGFAGVVAWDERYRVTRETLTEMSARIAHRGPDGQGIYFSPDVPVTCDQPQVALAHRRLAILDPDPRANQPFTDQAGRWIVFNGEIYNFRELRAELSTLEPTYRWRTHCDTEVLLAAYRQWGENCVAHLNGMFAFAVWDEPNQLLYLARDRMGQKPLFLAQADTGAIAFASELNCLRCVPWFNNQIDQSSLINYLRYGYIACTKTIFQGAQKLDPGSWLVRSDAEQRAVRYFIPSEIEPTDQLSDTAAQTRSVVSKAVIRQLVSDVPLGVLLSGGIDSSIVAACAREAGEVQTFCAAFDDPRYDESRFAAEVARHLGTKHHVFHVSPDAVRDLPKLCEVFGEPFADSSALPTHLLARETREHVKVALSGDGGDELFGGYDRYRAMQLAARLDKLGGKNIQGMGGHIAGGHPKSRLTRAGRFLASLGMPPAQRYDGYMRVFPDDLLESLLPSLSEAPERLIASCFARLNARRDVVRAAAAVDRQTYLPDDLLTKVDRASMLHALEVRSPFMDHELVQFATGLSSDQLIKGGPKRMLRESFARDLPAWVFKRKKMGFAVPIGQWFRGELRPMLRDHLFAADSFASRHFNRAAVERLVNEHEAARTDHSQRLYALLMLELWWKTAKSA